MGTEASSAIDSATEEEIKKVTKKICDKFSVDLSREYQQIVQLTNSGIFEVYKSSYQLKAAPVASDVLYSGLLTKRGGSVSSWKERFFLILNEKDNYRIEYKDDKTKELKGIIHPGGYRVYEFSEDDIHEQGGDFGFKLEPDNSHKRTWYFRCKNETERQEWLTIFDYACYKATVPVNDTHFKMRKAFDGVLRRYFWSSGLYHSSLRGRNETDILTEYVFYIIDRLVLKKVINEIPDSSKKAKTVACMRQDLEGNVLKICTECWTTSHDSIKAMSSTVENNIDKKAAASSVEKYKKLKWDIAPVVEDFSNEVLVDKSVSLMQPIAFVLVPTVRDAFTLAIKGFYETMLEKAKLGLLTSAKDITAVYRDTHKWYGYLHQSNNCVYGLYRDKLATVVELLTSVSSYTIYNMVLDKIKFIMNKAIFTLSTIAENTNDQVAGLKSMMKMVYSDSLLAIEKLITNILTALMEPIIGEDIVKPSFNQIEAKLGITPIAEPIISTVLEETVFEMDKLVINELLKPFLEETKEYFVTASAELELEPLKF